MPQINGELQRAKEVSTRKSDARDLGLNPGSDWREIALGVSRDEIRADIEEDYKSQMESELDNWDQYGYCGPVFDGW